jgi:anti-sigma regulatory factor (Ser/Thr protein kinase)
VKLDVAERRLQSAIAEQTRLTARYDDAVGTSAEFAAYSRLEGATRAVTNCDRALRASRTESTNWFSFVIVSGLDGPRAARAEVRKQISGLVDAEVIDDAMLLVSEVVTNAVKHGVPSDLATVQVAGEISEQTVRVEVVNAGGPFDPESASTDSREPGGRGLLLVDSLSNAWGTDYGDGHTTVWFEMTRETVPVLSALLAE